MGPRRCSCSEMDDIGGTGPKPMPITASSSSNSSGVTFSGPPSQDEHRAIGDQQADDRHDLVVA